MTNRWLELRGVNTHNKGAQLMMMAVSDRLRGTRNLTISPNGTDFDVRTQLGFHQTLLLNQAPTISRIVGNVVPSSLRSSFGLVADRQIGGVLDAAGFAYSDSFTPDRSRREAALAKRWEKRGVPVVLLPQAFGPFENAEQARWSRALLESASLVFARDRQSLAYVTRLSAKIRVKLSPDFTIGLKPHGVPSPIAGEFGAIVPNAKMISHTKLSEAAYVGFLVKAAQAMRSSGLRPVVVIHEFSDRKLGALVQQRAEAEIFESPDPLVLKKALSDAQLVVGSRFHAIVSALSSYTPVVALGWSHKYEELLGDFGASSWLAGADEDSAEVVSRVLHDRATASALRDNVPRLLEQNDAMWTDVESVLGGSTRTSGQSR